MALTAALVLVTVFGALALSAIKREWDAPLVERLALGFGVGFGLVTYGLFIAMAAGMRLSSALVLGAIGGLGAVSAIAAGARRMSWRHLVRSGGAAARPGPTAVEAGIQVACLAGALFLVAAAVVVALYWPVWWWDALTMYEFRARVLLRERSLDFMRGEGYWGSFPLHTSLMHAAVAELGGTRPQGLYPLYYAALLAVVYANLARLVGRARAAAFTFILASTPLLWTHATLALTNLPFAYYYSAGVLYVHRWWMDARPSDLAIGGLLLGLGAWTRYGSELVFGAVLLLVLLRSLKRRTPWAPLALLGIYATFVAPWFYYQQYVLTVTPNVAFGLHPTLFNGARWWLTVQYLARFLVSVESQGVIWLVFAVSLALGAMHRRASMLFPAGVVVLGLAAWTASIYITGMDIHELAGGSGERFLLTLVPVASVASAIGLAAGAGAETATVRRR